MRATIWGLAAVSLMACVRFSVFECSDASDCVLNGLSGRCEAVGFCSFPDPDCPTGYRYSEHAPSDLAHQCVEPDGGGTSGGLTVAGTAGDGSSGEGSTDADSEASSGEQPSCIDVDGDGAGVGEACDAPDCDDDNANVIADCVYIGPDGDDSNAGTREAPWGTFARAVSSLSPGGSLVLLDGTYDVEETGPLSMICGEGASSGTEAAPIFVRADHDRQAVIDKKAIDYGLLIEDCGYWRVRGLAITGADLASDQDGLWRSPITVGGSHHIELRQILASHTNRYYNEHAAIISGTEDILVEDVEVHDFFRSGFAFYRTNRATCRRCYGNSHEAADLPACPELADCPDQTVVGTTECPKCSGDPERGDATFYVEHSNDFLCENCVSEGSRRGYHVVGGTGIDGERAGSGIRILESVSIGDVMGIDFESNSESIPSRGAELVDFVAIAPSDVGVRIEDPDGLVLRHVTVVQPGGDGIAGREVTPERCLDSACSLTLDHVLVVGAGEDGIQISGPIDTWSVEWSNAFGSAGEDYVYPDIATDAFGDRAGNARLNRSEAATLIGLDRELCRVYVPEESNMHDVAGDGLDIGANVTNLLIDGVASGEALWATDGAFPCGQDPAAPPPIAGERCLDLAERTGVGTTACPAPAPRG